MVFNEWWVSYPDATKSAWLSVACVYSLLSLWPSLIVLPKWQVKSLLTKSTHGWRHEYAYLYALISSSVCTHICRYVIMYVCILVWLYACLLVGLCVTKYMFSMYIFNAFMYMHTYIMYIHPCRHLHRRTKPHTYTSTWTYSDRQSHICLQWHKHVHIPRIDIQPASQKSPLAHL